MKLLTAALSRLPEFEQLLTAVEGGRCPAALSGAAAVHRAHITAALGLKTERPIVEVPVLTPRSFTFHNAATVSRQWEHRRLALLDKLGRGELPFLVATVEGMLQRTLPFQTMSDCCRTLAVGQVCDLNELTEALAAAGYVRCDQV